MLAKNIELSARNKFLVFLLVGSLALWGVWAVYNTPLDAIPHLSDVQVIIFTEWPGVSPDLVLGQSEDVQRLAQETKDRGFWDTVNAFADNPAAAWQMTVEALAASVPAAYVAGKTGAVAGGAAGGALGSVDPGVGNVVGAAAGGLTGAVAGAGAASYAQSYTATMMDAMRESGYDLTDPAQIQAAFSDQQFMDLARQKSQNYALPVAVFDALSAGMAGKVYKAVTRVGRATAPPHRRGASWPARWPTPARKA